jgi:23S rRNA A2030 N6-methylase RlmJ
MGEGEMIARAACFRAFNMPSVPVRPVCPLNADRAAMPNGPRHYPGSPYIAWSLARRTDRLQFCDLHSTDVDVLGRMSPVWGKHVSVEHTDGFAAISRQRLPPAEGRGLVMLDPAYELKTDYTAVMDAMERGVQMWRRGVWMVWYPLLSSPVKAIEFAKMRYCSLLVARGLVLG